ncbi:MAG: alcohol dehydrogenase, partial [Acidimicrobiia bacterium]
VRNTAAVGPGTSVAVLGCGGVGLAAIQAARALGADPILAIDLDPAKTALASRLGATHAIDPATGVIDAVRRVCPLGVQVAIEAIGRTDTVEMAWEMLRPGGTAVVIGMPAARERVSLRMGGFFQARRVVGCVYGDADPRRDIPALIALVQSGAFDLDALVSDEIPLARAAEALDRLATGAGVRHVVVCGGER